MIKKAKQFITAVVTTAIICTLFSAVPAAAKDPDSYHLLNSTFNTKAVQNDPQARATLTIDRPTMIQVITTYHWNYGNGAEPGYISIWKDGVGDGRWKADGRSGSGVANVLWDVYPNYIMEPGHTYTIAVSDNSSWSWNDDAVFGFVELRGYAIGSSYDPGTGTSSASVSSGGYICSDWAKSEIENAVRSGLVPSNLMSSDLRQPINRRDFAAISVKVYELMSGMTLSTGSNPFNDTSDGEVLKAYAGGIVNGTSATTFEPSGLLTREQAATMLTRAYKKTVFAGWTPSDNANYPLSFASSAAFGDSYSISDYAGESVSYMSAKGIINGMGNNLFAPKNSVTCEQAIAIALRMQERLDTSPQTPASNKPSGTNSGEIVVLENNQGVAGPAQNNTFTYNEAVITFGSGATGSAALLGNFDNIDAPNADSDVYTLLLSDVPSDDITISLPVPAPEAGYSYRIDFGIPAVSEDGSVETVLTYPVDARYENGKAVATFRINNIAEAVESSSFYGGAGMTFKESMYINLQKSMPWNAMHNLSDVISLSNKGISEVYCWATGEKTTTSAEGHFKVRVPKKFVEAHPQYMDSGQQAESIAADLEEFLKDYEKTYKVLENRVRTTWPMSVYIDDFHWDALATVGGQREGYAYFTQPAFSYGGSAGFIPIELSYMKLNQMYFDMYDRRENASLRDTFSERYGTVAHELFHFIQRCYASQKTSSNWFDESSGVYYSAYYVDKIKLRESVNYSLVDVHYEEGWIAQFQALPGDLKMPKSDIDSAYCHLPLISFMMKTDPKSLQKAYQYMKDYGFIGSALTSWETLIPSVTGYKNMGEFTRDYFKHLVVKGDLYAKMNKPWEIYDKIQNTSNHELDQVGFSANVAADLRIPVSLRAYGATFIALDTSSIDSDKYGSFNIELGENMYAVAMCIFGDSYASIHAKESGEKLSYVSLSPKCLLMIVDESGKNHSDQIKITLNEIQEGTDVPLPFKDDDDTRITDVPSVSAPEQTKIHFN